MDRKSLFIQNMVIRLASQGVDRVPGHITLGEETWAILTERGYGDSEAKTKRERKQQEVIEKQERTTDAQLETERSNLLGEIKTADNMISQGISVDFWGKKKVELEGRLKSSSLNTSKTPANISGQ